MLYTIPYTSKILLTLDNKTITAHASLPTGPRPYYEKN